ncbi:extracellular solute-binding protein [Halomonas sp. DQ26W]|uniref:extracellular solute-binding protein n=1 Tax=Halomonas sp. DQ26W TaxID=2282311 RepID=UPI000DF78503|nr:extracellular solute-binding protein [Halomonas sp. DQ26W]RDB42522.1 extracellular solute-binding protein [Halomonas sp. DQ26W]
MIDRSEDSHPEGPYDRLTQMPMSRLSNMEFARFLDFVEHFEEETENSLSMANGYREMRMMLHLMRNHLAGRLTTPTSLADASGLSYGTAKRRIESIMKRGLILSRPRTKSGKTVSLHPSPVMIAEWERYANRIKALLGPLFGVDPASELVNRIFHSADSGCVISTPAVLSERLEIKGGLRVLIHADPTFMAMHNLKRQLESIFGLEIHNTAKSIDRLLEEILDNARRATSRYDLVACDLPWFGELASKGVLMPLDRLIERDRQDLSDFHSVAIRSARYAGQQYGIPLQTTPELLCYRKDLLEHARLEAPTTTEALIKVARHLHDPGKGRYGIAWNAARGTPLGHTFTFLMAKFGQPIINLPSTDGGFDYESASDDALRPMFLSDAAYQSCEYMLDILKYSPPNILEMAWYERAKSYSSGESCMAYCYTLLAPLIEFNRESPARGNTGYLPHPTGQYGRTITPIGGYALGIPANLSEERVEAAWTALRYLASASMSKLYIMNGSLVTPRFSVSQDPEVAALSPLIGIVDDMARRDILQAWPRPPVPGITDLISIAGNEIFEVLDGRRSIKKALSMAQDRADRIMRDRGHY